MFCEWFKKQSKVVQVILLLIPVVNWFVEIIYRWSSFAKNGGVLRFIVALLLTLGIGIVWAWVDIIFVLVTNNLLLG